MLGGRESGRARSSTPRRPGRQQQASLVPASGMWQSRSAGWRFFHRAHVKALSPRRVTIRARAGSRAAISSGPDAHDRHPGGFEGRPSKARRGARNSKPCSCSRSAHGKKNMVHLRTQQVGLQADDVSVRQCGKRPPGAGRFRRRCGRHRMPSPHTPDKPRNGTLAPVAVGAVSAAIRVPGRRWSHRKSGLDDGGKRVFALKRPAPEQHVELGPKQAHRRRARHLGKARGCRCRHHQQRRVGEQVEELRGRAGSASEGALWIDFAHQCAVLARPGGPHHREAARRGAPPVRASVCRPVPQQRARADVQHRIGGGRARVGRRTAARATAKRENIRPRRWRARRKCRPGLAGCVRPRQAIGDAVLPRRAVAFQRDDPARTEWRARQQGRGGCPRAPSAVVGAAR